MASVRKTRRVAALPHPLARLSAKDPLRVAGLMSGTSADGIDVAIVDFERGGLTVLAFETVSYRPALRRAIFDAFDPATGRVDLICRLNVAVGEAFAAAVRRTADRAGIPLASIDLIGSHGQTIHHLPNARRQWGARVASTLQIGEPGVIAERTGITTVADFRPRDVAAGGQGAPLVPYADVVLYRHATKARAIQNIGGIANVTYLPPNGPPYGGTTSAALRVEGVLAFDTGPGNMVIDRLVSSLTGGRRTYDRDGRLARRGRVHAALLGELMRHPYFRRRPPKTTGREEFGAVYADRLRKRGLKLGLADADLVATATALTARSIADAYRRFLPAPVDEVILCGGGARNPTLAGMLAGQLAPAAVMTTDDLGLSADAKEAVSFAILARETLRGRANNVPSATGARRAVILGKIVLA
ncbi:MAG: Anhydro-N-acetylmuramic acid kinase [Planctomycetes bacterium ADurb.Bin126]|nr:MAG: Anhydro-N-acetylmuramic acid kinase [Planctomycetes bacterium ADurb.Bin126]HOD84410.1 anhydro-N-acetylmuramic acid kinase [Phycisphaerae bacterium]HQL73027.1 anhydro-N-acetylmuramic acid kinase [Phycisphaerae bacterium]